MRKFGIELEFFNITKRDVRVALNKVGVSMVIGSNRRGSWRLKNDQSVTNTGTGRIRGTGGHELVSPILSGREGLEEAKKVASALAKAGARVDQTCGFHLHIDAAGLSGKQLKNILLRYAKHEEEIKMFMPRSRRGNEFCYDVSRYLRDRTFLQIVDPTQISLWCDHYDALSLESYLTHGTIEFRHHSGTLNGTKIENWWWFAQTFVEVSKNINSVGSQHSNLARSFRAHEIGKKRTERIQKIYKAFLDRKSHGYNLTITMIAKAAGIEKHLVGSYISSMRTAYDAKIDKKGNYYKLLNQGDLALLLKTETQATNADTGLWMKMPPEVQAFYEERAMELA